MRVRVLPRREHRLARALALVAYVIAGLIALIFIFIGIDHLLPANY